MGKICRSWDVFSSKTILIAAVLALFASVGTASAETTLEKIKRTGKTTVGTEAAFPPFEFIKDGKIVGFEAQSKNRGRAEASRIKKAK